jgi:uncharacterized membrane protein
VPVQPDVRPEPTTDVGELRRVERGAADRLLFFSDAVVAIAITLLAIDLPVPKGDELPVFLASLAAERTAYLSFLLSFGVIAWHWTAHHRVLRYLVSADRRMVFLEMGWLLFIVLTPFLTKAIEESAGIGAFGLYALAQAAQLTLFSLLVHRASSTGRFVRGGPALTSAHGWVGAMVAAAGFLVSIPAHLLIGSWAFALWVLVPMLLTQVVSRRVTSAERG